MTNPYSNQRLPSIRGVTTGGISLMSRYKGLPSWQGERFGRGNFNQDTVYGGDQERSPYNQLSSGPAVDTRRPRTPLTRVAPDHQFTGQNTSVLTTAPTASAGGTITRNGMTRAYAPTPARDPGMNVGGVMQRTGMVPVTVPQSPSVTPNPVSANVQQTERANPLSGAINPQPQGTSAPINPLGMTQRGTSIPNGDDATSMGTGIFDRTFRNRRAQENPYAGMVRSLFGSGSGGSLSVI